LATNDFSILSVPRSHEWPKVRRGHLKHEPDCQWDFCTNNIEVHHIRPFHVDASLELDTNNLITLCSCTNHRCHIDIGHLGNYRTKYNLNVKEDCNIHKTNKLYRSLSSK
jgi:hypothetical protein